MHEFTIRFNPDSKSLQFPDFEKNLALRLLDVLCGRHKQVTPEDPVPFTSDRQDTLMIGNHNDFWLKREDAATYRVFARYADDKTQALMNAAKTVIDAQYESMLAPPREEPVRAQRLSRRP